MLTRGELRPSGPVVIRHRMGRSTPGDIVWTTNASPLIVHTRIVDLLLDQGLTGWGTYPVEVYGKEGELFRDYFGFTITGRCGPIDGSRSQEASKQYPARISSVWVGLYFDENSWDGSDFFMTSDLTGWKFVTDRTVEAFATAKVKGVSFDSLDTIELPFDPGT